MNVTTTNCERKEENIIKNNNNIKNIETLLYM